jgi:penicillin-binding protein 1A
VAGAKAAFCERPGNASGTETGKGRLILKRAVTSQTFEGSGYEFLIGYIKSKTTWAIFGVLVALIVIPGLIYIAYLSQDLPSLTQLEEIRPKLVSKVFSSDGRIIKEFFEERRSYVPLDSMPQHLKEALMATEDRSFYNHWGFNTVRFAQAMLIDLIHMEKRQGASTITQQLARVLYFTTEKTVSRKIRELLTAMQIERTYTKAEILEMYLNQVYLGHGAHGVQMAAQKYFGKNVHDLQPHESALLIALVQRPETLSPEKSSGAGAAIWCSATCIAHKGSADRV